MRLSLFDLHCDTACEMLAQGQELTENTLAVSLRRAEIFEQYVQVMAFWTDRRLDDEEGWAHYRRMLDNLRADPALREGRAVISTVAPPRGHKPTLLLGVEDARILAGHLERIDRLYADGVRLLIPMWSGVSCLGGAHDTSVGLTEFGRRALTRAAECGMITDLSHASIESADEMLEIAARHSRPVIASHSNAYDVCPVGRNLRRGQIRAIVGCDGIIGLNLYRHFLKLRGDDASAEDVIPHVELFLEEGAERALCLGCDMDGCTLPSDIPDVGALPRLAELLLRRNYSEQLVRAIFYENAHRFASNYLTDLSRDAVNQ